LTTTSVETGQCYVQLVAQQWLDEDPGDWVMRRYRVTFQSVLSKTTVYGVESRCGEHKAVAVALRFHLLGPNDFYQDFPLHIEVEEVNGEFTAADLVTMEASWLSDLNED